MPTPSSNLTVYHDIGSGKHRQLINVSRRFLGCMYSVEKTVPVPSKGRRKVGPLKKLEKHPRFYKAFRQFGEEWNLKYHVLKLLEEFTCLMYGTASLRWTASVPNSCARSWLRTRNSLPNLRSTWFAFLPATLL